MKKGKLICRRCTETACTVESERESYAELAHELMAECISAWDDLVLLRACAEWWMYDVRRTHRTVEELWDAVGSFDCPFDMGTLPRIDVPDDDAFWVASFLWEAARAAFTVRGIRRCLTVASAEPARDVELMAEELLEVIGAKVEER